MMNRGNGNSMGNSWGNGNGWGKPANNGWPPEARYLQRFFLAEGGMLW